jgi:DNA repair exonuclease SbcCD ATPase subunit
VLNLKKLKLFNFMSISDIELEFNNNIILISGENASGKSSILEAIALCLTSKKRSSSYQDYVQQGKEFSKIYLECEINNEPVYFDIQLNLIKGNPFQIALTYKGQIYNNKETEDIIESFGLGYYTDLMFSMQLEDDITKLTPAQRAYYLQKLLNFDFDSQKISLKKDLDQFEEILRITNIEIPFKQQNSQREYDSLEELKKITNTEEDIEKEKLILIEKEKQFVIITKNIEEYSNLNKQINTFNIEIQELNKSIITKESILKNIKETIEKNKKSLKKAREFANENVIVQNEINVLQNKLEEINILSKEIDNEINDLYNNKIILVALKVEIDRLEKLYDSDKCPYCGQETKESAESQYINYITSQDIPDGLLDDTSSILLCKSSIYQKINEYEKLLDNKNIELASIKKESDFIEKNIFFKELFISKNKGNILSLSEETKKEYTEDFLNSLKKEIETFNDKLLAITTQKNKIQSQVDAYSNIKISDISKEIDALKNKISSYYTLVKINEEIEKRNLKRKENIKNIQEEIEKLQQKNLEILQQKNTYEEAYRIFDKDLPNFMSIKACSVLQNNINEFIQNILPDYEVSLQASKKGCEFFYTKNKQIKKERKKNNFLINSKMSSGFERALLTMAFKVSLAQLYSCDCLFLDESDGSATEDNTQLLYENLIDTNIFNQIFIITHKNSIKEFIINNYQAQNFEIEKGKLIVF